MGGTYSGETTMRVSKNELVTLQVPSKANYTFPGWDISGTNLSTSDNTITVVSINY